MEYKDKDGKVIEVTGVDEKIIGVVGRIVEGQIAAVQTAVQTTVATAIGKIAEQIKPLADKVETLGKAAATGTPNKNEPVSDIQKAIEAALKPVLDTVTALKTEREGELKAKTSRSLAEQLVGKERPNLRGKDRLVARIAGAGVTTEEEARKVMAEWDAEMKDLLGEDGFKGLSASPQGEGAKTQAKGTDAEKAQAKADLLKTIKTPNAA